jgi:Rha family phage regulatory protein
MKMSRLKVWDSRFGVYELDGRPVVGSKKVAEVFGKEHAKTLRSIAHITQAQSGLSKAFTERNFVLSEYKDSTGRTLPEYYLTRDGFIILVMGFTGKRAMQFKEAYINKFNEMEQYILALHTARLDFPELTAAILEMHVKPQQHHFSNEMDMINRIVLGMSAKQFKEVHGLGDVKSIRPYLDAEQLALIGMLQKTDIGLVLTEPDFHKRRRTLEWYCAKLKQKFIVA